MTAQPDQQLVLNVKRLATFPISVVLLFEILTTRSATGYWCGCGRSQSRSRSRDQSRRNIHEAEFTHDTSKHIIDSTNSEVNVVKLLQAYCMVNSEGSELRYRKVKQ